MTGHTASDIAPCPYMAKRIAEARARHPKTIYKFAASKAALAVYDATRTERDAIDDPAAYQAAEAEALRLVRLAFAEDTSDYNRLDQAMLAQLQWVREFVADAEAEAAGEPMQLALFGGAP